MLGAAPVAGYAPDARLGAAVALQLLRLLILRPLAACLLLAARRRPARRLPLVAPSPLSIRQHTRPRSAFLAQPAAVAVLVAAAVRPPLYAALGANTRAGPSARPPAVTRLRPAVLEFLVEADKGFPRLAAKASVRPAAVLLVLLRRRLRRPLLEEQLRQMLRLPARLRPRLLVRRRPPPLLLT